MRKAVLAAMIAGILLIQAGCSNAGTGRVTGQEETSVQENPAQYIQQAQNILQTESYRVVAMYITEVHNSYKGIDGYVNNNSEKNFYEYQGLDDKCTFYNYEGEQIAFIELSRAVKDYMADNPAGVLCNVIYSGKNIVSIKIEDRAVNITNTDTILPTLYYHMN